MADPTNKWSQPAAPPGPMFFGKKERDLVKTLNEKYGPGQLDPATGVFTPVTPTT